MGLMTLDRTTHSRTTSAWAKCLWGWAGYWKIKSHKSQQNWLRQRVGQFVLRSINLLFRF